MIQKIEQERVKIENDKIKMFKECNKMQEKLEDEISLRL